ncbi:pyruvate, phosphate dikinase [Nocardia takedensis]
MTATPDPSILVLDGRTTAGREMLGGKAWSLQRMLTLGLAVPPAFVFTTEVCRRYHAAGRVLPAEVWDGLPAAMAELESATGRRFGVAQRPLLVSVRSGAAISMPGMMDTILDLGMTDEVEKALAAESGTPAYAADTHRRFLEQFEKVVGRPPPANPWEQLRCAVLAVLDSWNSPRARFYRDSRGLPHDAGTAVTVQAMVFGNLDENSGAGVLFSRNPLTGAPEPYGEWLPRGQGEDVVSGRSDARPLSELATALPEVHAELLAATARLEADARNVQDIEYTVQGGVLWLLQARVATRTPEAAIRHAVALQRAGIITASEALNRVQPEHVQSLLSPRLDPVGATVPLASGKPACPGIATGVVAVDPEDAEVRAARGEMVILARPTTDPDDVAAMSTAVAVITELGGSTSHAAVVCREMAVPCVVGCGTGTLMPLAGRTVTVDATNGAVYAGAVDILPAVAPDDPDLVQLNQWAESEPAGELSHSLLAMLRRYTVEEIS